MKGTREEFLNWDQLMENVGIPKEQYVDLRADKFARLIVNSTPAHLTLQEWFSMIGNAIAALTQDYDPNEPLENVVIMTNLDPTDPNP